MLVWHQLEHGGFRKCDKLMSKDRLQTHMINPNDFFFLDIREQLLQNL